MKKTRSLFILSIFGLLVGVSGVQAQEIKDQILNHLEHPFSKMPVPLAQASYDAVSPAAYSLMADTSFKKKSSLMQFLGIKARQDGYENQQAFVEWGLLMAFHASIDVRHTLLGQLKKLPAQAFSPKAQELLGTYLMSSPPHLNNWVMLAGFATKDKTIIQNLLRTHKGRSVQQACRLALARMGDKNYSASFLKNIKKIPVEDDFVYDIAPLAIYIRDKATTQYLMDIIIKNKGRCSPADAETSGQISCSYRLMEMLSLVLIDFPVPINEAGEFLVDDYPKALQAGQAWMKKQRNRFKLDDTRY